MCKIHCAIPSSNFKAKSSGHLGSSWKSSCPMWDNQRDKTVCLIESHSSKGNDTSAQCSNEIWESHNYLDLQEHSHPYRPKPLQSLPVPIQSTCPSRLHPPSCTALRIWNATMLQLQRYKELFEGSSEVWAWLFFLNTLALEIQMVSSFSPERAWDSPRTVRQFPGNLWFLLEPKEIASDKPGVPQESPGLFGEHLLRCQLFAALSTLWCAPKPGTSGCNGNFHIHKIGWFMGWIGWPVNVLWFCPTYQLVVC